MYKLLLNYSKNITFSRYIKEYLTKKPQSKRLRLFLNIPATTYSPTLVSRAVPSAL